MEEKENIVSKDNIDVVVYNILNEAYHEFVQTYGEKHSSRIKEAIESITDKVKPAHLYYSGPNASANSELGVVYTKSDKLSAVLKHEMWHVYNKEAGDRELSIQHIPKRYFEKLERSGYLEDLYNKTMQEYKEKWKDEPIRLEHLLVDFEKFKNDKFDFGPSPVEMWTEWFNSQTHLKDMQDNFWDWGDGYFTKSRSSNSFYDAYINVASIISCIIPKEKLLEMYLQTKDYKTDYSYPEMLEYFDENFSSSLNDKEKHIYEYPYLKILMNVETINNNARENPTVARQALQSCMKTCFNAYIIKLENITSMDINTAKQIYSEIKYMQERMVWNVDLSKMHNLDYIQAMNNIQSKFKNMIQELDIENPEVKTMYETIDYASNNPYKLIEDGEKIASKMINIQKGEKCRVINIGDYKVAVSANGIKDNLYESVFQLLGDEKIKLLFENFQGNKDNLLLKFHKLIESAEDENDIITIYNKIYDLYAKKMEENLKIDKNIQSCFRNYSKEIVELQKNALFDEEKQEYLPGLEHIMSMYNEKVKAYEQEIDKLTQEDIQENLARGRDIKTATEFAERVPNRYKQELEEQNSRINARKE